MNRNGGCGWTVAAGHREGCTEERLAGNGGPGMASCGSVDQRQGRSTVIVAGRS
ncbi:hypothetical protein [Blautia massiliensis (ex Durand et al. 2017)]|uniref:hypothetical protein n=1 Tax=Blautia massiliensis (ex Durand et al. 2017) TaxID=1737424 RepID=UPI000ABB2E0F|nr:hypothetical protein [Blautia massiliensis (ex Durand et al. 2017)]